MQGKRVSWYDVQYAGIDEDGKVELNGLQENFSKLVSHLQHFINQLTWSNYTL